MRKETPPDTAAFRVPHRPPEAFDRYYYLVEQSRAARTQAHIMRSNGQPEDLIRRVETGRARRRLEDESDSGTMVYIDSPNIIHSYQGKDNHYGPGPVAGRLCDIVYGWYPDLDMEERVSDAEGLLMVLMVRPDAPDYQPENWDEHARNGDICLVPVEATNHIRSRQEFLAERFGYEQEKIQYYLTGVSHLLDDPFEEWLSNLFIENELEKAACQYGLLGRRAEVSTDCAWLEPSESVALWSAQCRKVAAAGRVLGLRWRPEEVEGGNGGEVCLELEINSGGQVSIGKDSIECQEPVVYSAPVDSIREMSGEIIDDHLNGRTS